MHDKMNDEESIDNVVNSINEYFDIDSLNIEDLNKKLCECNLDNE